MPAKSIINMIFKDTGVSLIKSAVPTAGKSAALTNGLYTGCLLSQVAAAGLCL